MFHKPGEEAGIPSLYRVLMSVLILSIHESLPGLTRIRRNSSDEAIQLQLYPSRRA